MPYKDHEKRKAYSRAYSKKHYQENKQYYKDKARQWEKDNPERAKETRSEQGKRNYRRNKKKIIERHKRWTAANREKANAYNRKSYHKRTKRYREQGLCTMCGGEIDKDDILLHQNMPGYNSKRQLHHCIRCRMRTRVYVDRKRGHRIKVPYDLRKSSK